MRRTGWQGADHTGPWNPPLQLVCKGKLLESFDGGMGVADRHDWFPLLRDHSGCCVVSRL